MRENFVKRKLKRGNPSIGTWIELGHPDVAEILGKFGFDWVIVDLEHAPISVQTLAVLMQAMGNSPTLPFVRVPSNDEVAIKRVLDIGAYGVVVPSVSSREEAERAVKACRYPQKGGVRGLGPRRASEYYLDNDYFKVVDDEILIAIQIETEEAVRNLREIFSVDGLDVAIVGHWDLSMSMGIFKQFDHPRMKEAIQSVLDEARRAGIAPGIASSADEINDNIARGFIFNSLSSDTEILIQGYIQAIRKIQGWEPHPLAHVIGS